jgi:hypothetical protein
MATRCDRCAKETLATIVSMFNLVSIRSSCAVASWRCVPHPQAARLRLARDGRRRWWA